jgi:protein-tyrosine phosphatase
MAEVVLRHEAAALGLAGRLEIDSAGTAAEVGMGLDRRARHALEQRGYAPHRHRARQFEAAWLAERELVIALDRGHLRWLRSRAPGAGDTERVHLLLSYANRPPHPGTGGLSGPERGETTDAGRSLDIPDPYFGDERQFESCLDLVQAGCAALLIELATELGSRSDTP